MDGIATRGTGSTDHVDPEDLAALVDGKLPAEDCGRVRVHLAECEECYELFADVVRFQEEERAAGNVEDDRAEGVVKPFPFAKPSRGPVRRWLTGGGAPAWLPAAAAALLVVVGWAGWMAYPAVAVRVLGTVGTVAATLPGTIASFQPTAFRGGPEDGLADLGFQLGVRTIELQIHLKNGNARAANGDLQQIVDLLKSDAGMSHQTAAYERLQTDLAKTNPTTLTEPAHDLAQELAAEFAPNFDYGAWAEATRIAAISGQEGFFSDRKNRYILSRLADPKDPADDPAVLGRFEQLWDTGKIPKLQNEMEALLQLRFDPRSDY